MNRQFLQEAIADAKAVKESAIANAKVALEEAFSPQLQSMFASKIEEMDKDEDKMEEGYDEQYEAMDDDAKKMEEKMSDPDMRHGEDEGGKPEAGALKATEKDREIKEEDDMSLDEILAELEKDEVKEDARTDAEEEGYLDGMKDEKEDLKEDERTDAEEEGYLDGEKDEKEDMEDKEDEDIDLEDMSEDDLKAFIEDVIEDMVSAGELEAGESFEDDVDVEVSDEEEIEVQDDEEVSVDVSEAKEDVKEEDDEKKKMEEDLNEAMETIATLRSELNEINLLNAKLLYANKIFKSKNLTESQKAKVLGAFDKATTVKEAKIVYSTISENLVTKKKTVNESVIGRASKTSITPKVAKKKPIVESDEMVNRFKKLAGII